MLRPYNFILYVWQQLSFNSKTDELHLVGDFAEREQLVEDFIKDVKRHGITEIRERCSLAVSKRDMLESRYVRDKKYYYSLYYIMQ